MTPDQLTLARLLPILIQSAALFLAVLAVAWAAESFFPGLRRSLPACRETRSLDVNLFADALIWAVPITIVTLLLSQAATQVSSAFGLELPKQELVLILQHPRTPTATRWAIALFALLEAPLLEEAIFRRFLFRNMLRARALAPQAAMVCSGAFFALAHFNAVTFVPLCFIGTAFAWAYYRTGRLLVPILIHFLFNLVNLLLALIFPEMT